MTAGSAALNAGQRCKLAPLGLPVLTKLAQYAASSREISRSDAASCELPRFIARAPNDVITGQPYKYRRANDGQFILYSVGWNEKDDGGVPGTALFDPAQGDWVWSYPAQ